MSTPPMLVVAGVRNRELFAPVLDGPLAEQPPAAYLVVRRGEPRTLAYVPGHRAPRDLAGGAAAGPPTRPPRRVVLTCPSPILGYVRPVFAPALPPSPAGTDVLADAVAGSAGLVYVLDARESLSPDRRDELTALAAAAREVVLVDLGDATAAARAVIVRQVPRLAGARWHSSGDLAAALTPSPTPAPEPVPSGLRSEATREDGTSDGSGASAGEAGAGITGAVRAMDDDTRWRAVLAAELRSASTAARHRLATALPAIESRCALDPAALPDLLDAELHALSLRTTAALNAAARGLIGAVFAEVVAGRFTDAVRSRVERAVRRQLDPDDDDRTLLVTATAGVAAVDGSAGALSATGCPVSTILPPIGVAVSGACHLQWHYRGTPDKATGRRWLHQAAEALERELGGVLDARFAALGEAVDAVAADAVDHGVLLA